MPIFPESEREIETVEFSDAEFTVRFVDGGSVSAPYWWYPRLDAASSRERENYEASAPWWGIHWPDIDEDISIAGLLQGAKAPNAVAPVQAAE